MQTQQIRNGESLFHEMLHAEWKAHENLWIGALATLLTLCLVLPALYSNASYLSTLLHYLSLSMSLIAALYLYAIWLLWKTLKKAIVTENIQPSQKDRFFKEVQKAIFWHLKFIVIFLGLSFIFSHLSKFF